MKIAIVTDAYPLTNSIINGGVAGVCYNLVTALRESKETNIEVIIPNAQCDNQEGSSTIHQGDLKIHTLVPSNVFSHYHRLLLETPRLLKKKLDELNFDIVHFHGSAIWTQCTRKPAVLTIHGINEIDTLYRGKPVSARLRSLGLSLTEGRFRKKIKHIIAISPYVRSFLNHKQGGQKIWDVPNPVSDSYFRGIRRPVYGRILCVGSVSPLKNQLMLIKAFSQILRKWPNAELRLAGSVENSSYVNQCQQMAEKIGVVNRLKCLGSLSVIDLQKELKKAHCMVLPSLQENAPLAISEAMAAGVPVLASRVGGIPWMVIEGVTGWLVNPTDIVSITSGLSRMLVSDNLDQMGEASKEKAKSYRTSVVAQSTLQVYSEILRN